MEEKQDKNEASQEKQDSDSSESPSPAIVGSGNEKPASPKPENPQVGKIPRNPFRDDKDNDYRKRGFMSAIGERTSHGQALDEVLQEFEKDYQRQMDDFETIYTLKVLKLEEKIKDYQAMLQEKQGIKAEFKVQLEEMKVHKKELEEEIKTYREQLNEILRNVGEAKESLILKRLDEIEKELNKIISIHENIETKQNPKFKKIHDDDKAIDSERIGLYRKLKASAEETYDDVKNRIRSLNNAGVNNSTAYILILIGWLSSLVAGWFFSLWSGPLPKFKDGAGIIENSSVRFLLIDLVAKYIRDKSWTEIIGGIMVYLLLIGVISWGCYLLLKRFGFIPDNSKINDNKKKENDENYTINPEEQDNILKAQFKANSWFALWLKIIPFILFVYLTLAVIAHEAFQKELGDDGKTKETNKLQDVFDSLTNQFMGTLTAVAFSGIILLYIIKVIEPRYIRRTRNNEDEDGKLHINWEIVAGLVLFILMIVSMIIAPSVITSPEDKTNYMVFYELFSVSGFLFFCLTTGLGLGYGYRYTGLRDVESILLRYLQDCNNLINALSKPRRVNYIDDETFKSNIEVLQFQMLSLIAKRNMIAQQLSGGKDESVKQMDKLLEIVKKQIEERAQNQRTEEENQEKAQAAAQTEQANAENSPEEEKLSWFEKIQRGISGLFKRLSNKEEEETKKQEAAKPDLLTEEEEAYFPEYVTKIKEINAQIAEREKEVKSIDEELEGYLKNERTTRSLNDQIKNIKSEITQLNNEIIKTGDELRKEKVTQREERIRKRTLIKEGFQTGLWFLKNGGDLRDIFLP